MSFTHSFDMSIKVIPYSFVKRVRTKNINKFYKFHKINKINNNNDNNENNKDNNKDNHKKKDNKDNKDNNKNNNNNNNNNNYYDDYDDNYIDNFVTITVYVIKENDFYCRSTDFFQNLKEKQNINTLIASSHSASRYLLSSSKIANELKMQINIFTERKINFNERLYNSNQNLKLFLHHPCISSSELNEKAKNFYALKEKSKLNVKNKNNNCYMIPWNMNDAEIENCILQNLNFHWLFRKENANKKVNFNEANANEEANFNEANANEEAGFNEEANTNEGLKTNNIIFNHKYICDRNLIKNVWVTDEGGLISRVISKFFTNAHMKIVCTGRKIWPDLIKTIPKKTIYSGTNSMYQEGIVMPLIDEEQDLYHGGKIWKEVHQHAEEGDVIWLPN